MREPRPHGLPRRSCEAGLPGRRWQDGPRQDRPLTTGAAPPTAGYAGPGRSCGKPRPRGLPRRSCEAGLPGRPRQDGPRPDRPLTPGAAPPTAGYAGPACGKRGRFCGRLCGAGPVLREAGPVLRGGAGFASPPGRLGRGPEPVRTPGTARTARLRGGSPPARPGPGASCRRTERVRRRPSARSPASPRCRSPRRRPRWLS
jgi:hypothetical protein